MQTAFFRSRWTESLIFFEKQKNRESFLFTTFELDAICTCFNYFVIYGVKKIGSIALVVF